MSELEAGIADVAPEALVPEEKEATKEEDTIAITADPAANAKAADPAADAKAADPATDAKAADPAADAKAADPAADQTSGAAPVGNSADTATATSINEPIEATEEGDVETTEEPSVSRSSSLSDSSVPVSGLMSFPALDDLLPADQHIPEVEEHADTDYKGDRENVKSSVEHFVPGYVMFPSLGELTDEFKVATRTPSNSIVEAQSPLIRPTRTPANSVYARDEHALRAVAEVEIVDLIDATCLSDSTPAAQLREMKVLNNHPVTVVCAHFYARCVADTQYRCKDCNVVIPEGTAAAVCQVCQQFACLDCAAQESPEAALRVHGPELTQNPDEHE
jgi:hypothetical protein